MMQFYITQFYIMMHFYIMQQKSTVDKTFFVSAINFSRKSHSIDDCLYSLRPKNYSDLNYILYLETHEELNFEVKYEATRKDLGYGVAAFRKVYRACKNQRGVK
jgi:hypothetical protein